MKNTLKPLPSFEVGEVFMTDQSGNGHHLKRNKMKKLSDTLTELGIAFGFPIIIEDANGKVTYCEDSDDNWVKWEFDANGNETYYEDSNGNWGKWEFDANGKVTYFEDCDGYWGRYERDVKGRPTYHEGSNGFWQRWERDANGDFDYYEDSTGVKKGTPESLTKPNK